MKGIPPIVRPVASVREIIGTANRIVASAEVKRVPVSLRFMRAELEPDDAESHRESMMPAGADAAFLDREKIVWQWPYVSARLIEDFR